MVGWWNMGGDVDICRDRQRREAMPREEEEEEELLLLILLLSVPSRSCDTDDDRYHV